MQVQVNGAAQELPAGSTVQDLLDTLSRGTGRIAVELNGEIVPRSNFAGQGLAEGDTIEIVQAIGGG